MEPETVGISHTYAVKWSAVVYQLWLFTVKVTVKFILLPAMKTQRRCRGTVVQVVEV